MFALLMLLSRNNGVSKRGRKGCVPVEANDAVSID